MLCCPQWLDVTNHSAFKRTPDAALALHCGPVLLAQKPAALLALPRGQYDAACGILNALSGPCHRVLRRSDATVLLLVYDAQLLAKALAAPVPRSVLGKLGYPVSGGVPAMLDGLARRLESCGDFPHEIGFFLGYPQRDVLGFMAHRGQRCKLSGPWKVYGDVEQAKVLFDRYARCSAFLLACVRRDGGLVPALAATHLHS